LELLKYAKQKTFYLELGYPIREQGTARIAVRVITNKNHPIRSYFKNNKIHDGYATEPRSIRPIIIRAIEKLGQL
jgi:hypothetical protein